MLFLIIIIIGIIACVSVAVLFVNDDITTLTAILSLLIIILVLLGSIIVFGYFDNKYEQKISYSETFRFSNFGEVVEYLKHHEYLNKNIIVVNNDTLNYAITVDRYDGKVNWKYMINDIDSVKIYIKE